MSNLTEKAFFGVIADDFTGATDIAAMLARSGAPVSLHFGLEGLADVSFLNPFEVIALKCRTSPVEEALEEVRQAFDWLKAQGVERFFWKYCSTFDSTDKGNIGPVSEMLMAELGTKQAIYCPAFPQNGRSIYAGHLFVGDELLSDSSMKDHPLTPMRDANLMRLLAPQVKAPVGLVHYRDVKDGFSAIQNRLRALVADGVEHVVVDAIDDTHLAVIAGVCQKMPLMTGGSALAASLPALFKKAGEVDFDGAGADHPRTEATPLVLSGSCSKMTQKQVAFFNQHGPSFKLDPLELAQDGNALERAKDWLSEQDLYAPKLIYSSTNSAEVEKAQTLLGRDRAGTILENALSDLANHALSLGIRRMVVAGGETSGAVMQSLGIQRVEIGREITPGVPWIFANLEVETAAFALKSGNFGDETFFLSAFDKI